jgi:hypothetical protein
VAHRQFFFNSPYRLTIPWVPHPLPLLQRVGFPHRQHNHMPFRASEPPCCRNLAERTDGPPYPASSRTHHPVGAPSFAAFAKGGISHRQHNRMPFRASEPHRRHNLVERPHPSPGGAGIYACGKTALSLRLQPLRWLREPSINPPLNFLQPYFPTSTAKNE